MPYAYPFAPVMHQVLYSAFVTLLDEGRVKAARLESGTGRLYFDLKAQTEVASASATAATAATAAVVAMEVAASSSAPVTAQVSPAAATMTATPAASTSGPSAAAASASSAVTVPHRMQRHAYIKVRSASGALVALIRAAGGVAGQRLLSSGRLGAGTPLALSITSTVNYQLCRQIHPAISANCAGRNARTHLGSALKLTALVTVCASSPTACGQKRPHPREPHAGRWCGVCGGQGVVAGGAVQRPAVRAGAVAAADAPYLPCAAHLGGEEQHQQVWTACYGLTRAE